MIPQKIQPLVLIILDGFGHRDAALHNAIYNAKTPHWDTVWKNYPHTLIEGSGSSVGLPSGQMGNSEVGHLTMGAGRTVYQELTRINNAVDDGSFFDNKIIVDAIKKAVIKNRAVHVMGLLSEGGVHSHEKQIKAVLTLAVKLGAKKVYLHAFLDGRDTPPKSAKTSLEKIMAIKGVKIASMIGRYYAMDRDKRWDRTQKAYDLLTKGEASYHVPDAMTGLQKSYERGETDEFVKPTAIHKTDENPVVIEEGDTVVFMNFRADRARQLTYAFTDKLFNQFIRRSYPALTAFVSLTQYAEDIDVSVAFPPQLVQNSLGEYIAHKKLPQYRLAETEKYAHVTFFFNGGRETPFAFEERTLIPSPKVVTYDLAPEMSAFLLTENLIKAIQSKKYALIVCNYANPDMVGHTGNYAATVKAIEAIDACLGAIYAALKETHTEAIITADHGNAECMFDDKTQQAHTAHTSCLVPFVYIGRAATVLKKDGCLSDVAPTVLYTMGLPKPPEMTGNSLLEIT